MPKIIPLVLCFLALLHAFSTPTSQALVLDDATKLEGNPNEIDSTYDAQVFIVKRQADDFSGFEVDGVPDTTLIPVETTVSVSQSLPVTPTSSANPNAITKRQESTTQLPPTTLQRSLLRDQTTAPKPEITLPETGKRDTFDDIEDPPPEDPVTSTLVSIDSKTFTTPSNKVSTRMTSQDTTTEVATFASNLINRSTTPETSVGAFSQTTGKTTTIPSLESTAPSMPALTETETDDPFGDSDETSTPGKESTAPMQRPSSGSSGGRSAGRAAGGLLPTKSPSQPTIEVPRSSSSIPTDRPIVVIRSDNYGGILDPSSGFEKISLEEALVRGRAAAVAAGLGTEPEMFTWLIVLLMLLFSTVAWIWFCCVK